MGDKNKPIWVNFSSGPNPDLVYQWDTKRKLIISLAEEYALPSALPVCLFVFVNKISQNVLDGFKQKVGGQVGYVTRKNC